MDDIFFSIVGLWPGVEGQYGGNGGGGVEEQRGAAEHVQNCRIFNVWPQVRMRSEAESFIQGSV